MLYPFDFEVKINKEREIRERVQQAETDRLLDAIRPHRSGLFALVALAVLHGVGHLCSHIGHIMDQAETHEPMMPRLGTSH